MPDCIMLISGNAHRSLAESVAKELNLPLCDTTSTTFSDGELSVRIEQNIRGTIRRAPSLLFLTHPCGDFFRDLFSRVLLDEMTGVFVAHRFRNVPENILQVQ